LMVRGPWILSGYYREEKPLLEDGWFNTGDLAVLDDDNYVQLTDRAKDVIKSGGEWISSIEVENIAQAHPAIKEAAVVARPDEKWSERPVLVAVLKPGATFSKEDMVAHYTGKIAKWSIPEDLYVVEQLPHTATGKLLKTEIRKLVLGR